jgi:two-component system cell cycle sensor histidine kinase/response regulator CckA
VVTPPSPRQSQLDLERVRAHVGVVSLALVGTLTIAAFLAALQSDQVARGRALVCLGLLLAALTARWLTARAFRRAPDSRSPTQWLLRLRAGHALQGAVWGLAGVWLFVPADVPHQAFLAFAVGGVAAAAITLTAFDLAAGLLFLGLALLPLVIRFLAVGENVQTMMGISLALFLAYMAFNAVRAQRQWLEGVSARFEAGDRADELRALNDSLERVVEERTGALLENEARFRAVFDQSPAIIALISLPDHRLVEVNAAWEQAFGVPRDEAIGQTSADLGLWVDSDLRRRTLAELDAQGLVDAVEVEMRRRDGESFWVLLKSCRIAIGGRPYSLSTLVDITERKRALEDLAESEARFRAVFDQGPTAISLTRLADDRFVEVNDAGLRIFGYARDEVVGHTAVELGVWADEGDRERTIGVMKRDGAVSAVEVRLRRKGGEPFWALFSSSTVHIGGEPYGLTSLQDMTERRQLEARFLQSQKMEVLGHLAGGVAHDFNNVLTVIHSTAELALATVGADTPMHEALETIRDASARASGLTSQLLAFSRRQILQPAVLDLNDLIRDLLPMLRRAIGERITLDTVLAAAPATIRADRSSIEQVLLNLAINARDAMVEGGTLTVAVVVAPAISGSQVVLTISDTGIGMSEATRERVFEPFFTTKEAGKGTGLGLSTAHGIVTQSGGEITVRSAPGAGTTFTITLPLVARTPEPAAPGRSSVVGGDETILVVDDDADIREVVRRALSSAGYRVLLSASGDDALRQLGAHRGEVQLLLTDVVMPGLSGPDLAEQVHHQHPAVRVLYSSGFVDAAAEGHAGLGTGAPFIAKPYSLKALTQKVREVLDA